MASTTRVLDAVATAAVKNDVEAVLQGATAYLKSMATPDRRDRLWPAHYLVFATNPLSVAYGASGGALFLREADGSVPDDVVDWMLSQPVSKDSYPPGIFLGLAGVAYVLLELGLRPEAEAVMAELYESDLLFDEPGVFLGAAGWGLVSLHFYSHTQRHLYLDRAISAADYLLRSADTTRGTSWRCLQDGVRHYGFGYGASGIALFFLHLHLATGRHDYRRHAVNALESDIGKRTETDAGWEWVRFEGDRLLYPYWIHGSAGIGSVMARFHQLLGMERYGELARSVADDTFIKYSFVPSVFEGLAGVGELMLDVFEATGDDVYRRRAYDIAESVLWFKIDQPEGVVFPGRWLGRVSADYGTGTAGIGLFLLRLLKGGKRHFVDFGWVDRPRSTGLSERSR